MKNINLSLESGHIYGFVGAIASYENKINDEEIRDILKIVGLNPNDKKKLKNYSLGIQQKLALALALMENPKILILDEPLNAMDEESVHLKKI